MALAVGIALLIALVLAALLEYADSTIKSWSELQERMGLKVLGVLPVIEEDEQPADEVDKDGDGQIDFSDFAAWGVGMASADKVRLIFQRDTWDDNFC